MKKLYTILFSAIMLLTVQTNAQLNYIFSSCTNPYVPVTGGTTAHLTTDYTAWAPEDEGFAKVPIGFTFNYNGKNYDSANIDVNGFITFTDSLNIGFNYPYFRNNLTFAPTFGQRPIVAAFWDDLLLLDTSHLVYKTTGFAPLRVFTVEWKKAKWSYDAPAPVLSIELKLYETTNIIEFNYKDEGGMPYQQYAFASIGITSADANRDFISLQSTSSNPKISLLKSMDSLTVKPADNQVYRFIPSFIPAPQKFRKSYSYTNNKTFLHLNSGSLTGYEYAITRSPIAPSSGTKTFFPDITITSLVPATTYYVYARSQVYNTFNSQWVCDSFTTAVHPVAAPYHISGSNLSAFSLPADMREEDLRDTSEAYYPSGWEEITDFPHIGDTCIYGANTFYDANDWAFTPGIKLTAGKKYQLKFGYLSYYTNNPGDPAKVEIKYGTATGVAGMNAGILFNKTIRTYAPYDENGGLPFKDTIIEVTPAATDTYYFGFHNLSLSNYYAGAGIAVIGNFSVSEKKSSITVPQYVLKGNTNNTDNILSVTKINGQSEPDFEMQRSTDGIHFAKIGTINNENNGKINRPDFNKHPLTAALWNNLKGKPKPDYEKALQALASSLKNKTSSNVSNSKINTTSNYIDRNVTGVNYYRLQYTDRNGNVSYSNIVKLERAKAIRVYPNPAKDVLNVNLGSVNLIQSTLQVTNVGGNILMNKQIDELSKQNILQLNVSQLASGTYFIKIISADGTKTCIAKFEKQ